MSVEAIPLGGATLEELVAQLADSKAPSACPADSIAPTQILIVQAEGQPLQRLVIDFSGCGTVSNGKRSVLIPQMLKDLLGWTGKH
jgi:hypothetical protein